MPLRTLALYFFMCLLWGSTWAFSKIAVGYLPPFLFTTSRLVVAAVCLGLILAAQRKSFRLNRQELKSCLILGPLFFAIPFGFMMWAMQYTTGGVGAVIFATNPIFIFLISLFQKEGEKINREKGLGTFVGLSGALLVFLPEFLSHKTDSLKGDLAILISSLVFAGGMILVRKWLRQSGAVKVTFYQTLFEIPVLLAVGLLFEDPSVYLKNLVIPEAFGSLLYLSFFGSTLSVLLFFWFIKHYGPVIAASSIYLEIAFALLIDRIFFGLTPPPLAWFGIACILIGIWLVTKKEKQSWWRREKPLVTVGPT